ncbi:STAS domain-containing protein [Marinilabiliaceae bacterium ANBcel2]|nr:STAS domain-containing protein [Marinilabiliaceae bacterium ANBcel2]
MLTIEEKENQQIGVIEGTDRLNAPIAPAIKERLNKSLKDSDYTLTLNLKNIRFIDSTGIGVLISALKTARENNGSFKLQNVNDDVMSLLKLMKLDKVFDFSK